MAALTALSQTSRVEEATVRRPVPWHRMAWVTWRQHRAALAGVVAFLGVVSGYLWSTGLTLHRDYGAVLACRPVGSTSCFELTSGFNGIANFLSNGFILQVVPALIGAFLGAPMLARELETGTFRYAWTQGFGRWRWTMAKLVGLGGIVVVLAGAVSLVISWYFQPYFGARNLNLSLAQVPSLAPGVFTVRGPAFAAWTLAAFAIGCLAGLLIRRVVPAIVTTLAVYAALAAAAGGFIRQHYATPIATTALKSFSTAWVLSQQWLFHGRRERGRDQRGPLAFGGQRRRQGRLRPVQPRGVALPGPPRVHPGDHLPAGEPLLVVSADRDGVAARTVRAVHRRDGLAGPAQGGLTGATREARACRRGRDRHAGELAQRRVRRRRARPRPTGGARRARRRPRL